MKTVFPNLPEKAMARMVRELSQLRRLTRLWGTETVNGVEVFRRRKYFYPRHRYDESTKKLAQYLGIDKSIDEKMEGIDSAWLWLNPSDAPDMEVVWHRENIAANFNAALERNQRTVMDRVVIPATSTAPEYTKLVPRVEQTPVRLQVAGKLVSWDIETGTLSTLSPQLSDNASLADIKSRWMSGFGVSVQTEDPYLKALVLACIRGDITDVLSIQSARNGIATHTTTRTAHYSEVPYDIVTEHTIPAKDFVLDLTVPDPITASSSVINALIELCEEDKTPTGKTVRSAVVGASGDGELPAGTFTSNFWYTYNGVTYLRASFLTAPGKRLEKIKYFTGCIDSGHREKKLKWYQKAIAFIIIAAAVYVAGPSGGLAAAATFGAAVTVIAITITVAALYVAIAMYALAKMGRLNVATAMGQYMNRADLLIKFAGLWLLFSGLASIVQEGIKRAAVEEGRRRISDIAIEITKVAIERITGAPTISNIQMDHVVKMTSFVFDIYATWDTRRLEKEIKSKQKELDELRGQEEQAKVNDILKDLILAEPELLRRDNSVYAELYDLPYEWWSTPYHTGCMQANTVEGLWRIT